MNRKLIHAYKAEEDFWKQRNRHLWLALGDRNTGYFHASTKGRRARNKITIIENAQGEPVFEDDLISGAISDYFSNIFKSSDPPAEELINRALQPCISDDTNAKLISVPSAQEIKIVMFSIHPDKAPGPDGFSASFFQTKWDNVGPAITKEIQEFFTSGNMPFSI